MLNETVKSCLMLLYLNISTYINTKMSVCLSVCLFAHVFLGHFETDWETLWRKVSFFSWECSKTIILKKIFNELLPLFYNSLRTLCSVNLKSFYRKTKGGRNLILFAKKLTGHTEKFTGIFFSKRGKFVLFFFAMPVSLKSGIIAKPLYIQMN